VSTEELRRLVGWTVEDPSAGRSAGRVLGGLFHLLSTVVTLGADARMGARRPSWDVPADPNAYVDLGPLELRLPSTARAQRVQASRREVWTTSTERPPARLPVEGWRVTGAAPRHHSGRRDAEAPWTLTVTDGTATGTLTGAWLALAWIGHLAGWPEPTAAGT
jgi:hypothetical protein